MKNVYAAQIVRGRSDWWDWVEAPTRAYLLSKCMRSIRESRRIWNGDPDSSYRIEVYRRLKDVKVPKEKKR